MATKKSSGELNLETAAGEFFKCLTRKKVHVSFFFPAVDLRFEIKSEDEDKRIVTMSIVGNLISEMVEATLTLTPTPRGAVAKTYVAYTVEFENSHNIKVKKIVESLLTYILISDARNNNNKDRLNSLIVAGYPAEECFKDLVKAFKDDTTAYVKLEDVYWQNKICRMSFISPNSFLSADFKTVKVTTTVTPTKDDNNSSRVKWTIQAERNDDNTEEPEMFIFLSSSIRLNIRAKLRN